MRKYKALQHRNANAIQAATTRVARALLVAAVVVESAMFLNRESMFRSIANTLAIAIAAEPLPHNVYVNRAATENSDFKTGMLHRSGSTFCYTATSVVGTIANRYPPFFRQILDVLDKSNTR